MRNVIVTNNNGTDIYGTLDSIDSDSLVIFVHGFTGSQYEFQYMSGSKFLNKNNIDTFRFNFYGRRPNTRSLSDISFWDHVSDLNAIIDSFAGKYKKIILVGHSLGGLVSMNADLSNIERLILWDPTGPIGKLDERSAQYDDNSGKYMFKWERDFLVDKKLVDEWNSIDFESTVKNISIPCYFLFAWKFNMYDNWSSYFQDFEGKMDYKIVEGATHLFIEEGVDDKLFEYTLEYIHK